MGYLQKARVLLARLRYFERVVFEEVRDHATLTMTVSVFSFSTVPPQTLLRLLPQAIFKQRVAPWVVSERLPHLCGGAQHLEEARVFLARLRHLERVVFEEVRDHAPGAQLRGLDVVKRFRGGLVCKAHRLWYHSTLGSRAKKKKKKTGRLATCLAFRQSPSRSSRVHREAYTRSGSEAGSH